METIGVVRRIDKLGRIVLPKELRVQKDMDIGSDIEIYISNENIILKKYQPGCIFCGEIYDTIKFKGHLICSKCLESISVIEL